ncbi:17596_t:CDS:2, partial [Acaulospora morrowiae]
MQIESSDNNGYHYGPKYEKDNQDAGEDLKTYLQKKFRELDWPRKTYVEKDVTGVCY